MADVLKAFGVIMVVTIWCLIALWLVSWGEDRKPYLGIALGILMIFITVGTIAVSVQQ